MALSAGEALTFARTLADARLVGPLGLRQARALEPVVLHLQRLSALSRDLQDETLEASGQSPLRLERLDPQQALMNAVDRVLSHAASVSVDLSPPQRAPGLAVLADADELTDILTDMIRLSVDLIGRAGQTGALVLLDWRREGFVELSLKAVGGCVGPDRLEALQRPGEPLARLTRRAGRIGAALRTSVMPQIGVRMRLTMPGVGDDRPWPAPSSHQTRKGVVVHVGASGPERALLRLHCEAAGAVRLHGAAPGPEACALVEMLNPHLLLIDLDGPQADALCEEIARIAEKSGDIALAGLSGRPLDPVRARRLRRHGLHSVLTRPLRPEDVTVLLERSLPLADASHIQVVRG